jgi:ketosteroid isomerase-like protein
MRRGGRLAFALIVAAVPAASLAAPPSSSAQPQLNPDAKSAAATVESFHAALRRGDTAAAASLLANDALIYESGGVERSKAEYVAHHLPADTAFARAVASTLTRRAGAASGDFAWIASEGRTAGAFRGRKINSATTETMVLRRSGAAWRIVHIHWSSADMRD